jgi:hypothetical protein
MTNKIQKQISYGKIQILLKEKFEDIKGVIRSFTSQDRKYNGQKKKDKWTSNDLQNTTKKTCFIYVICIYVLVSNTIPSQMMFVSFNSNTTVSLVEQELITLPGT